MIGVLDSGGGGLYTYRLLRSMLPDAPLALFCDRPHAPYGTKRECEIVSLVSEGINALMKIGANRVLIACCTASTIYGKLPEQLRKASLPIIYPAAYSAAKSGERVAIIATSHTTSSHAFGQTIHEINPHVTLLERDAQPLVAMVDNGSHDGCCTEECREYLDSLARELDSFHPDTLLLGCTHFSNLEGELRSRLSYVRTVSPAREGARLIAEEYLSSRISHSGRAKNIYTEGKRR